MTRVREWRPRSVVEVDGGRRRRRVNRVGRERRHRLRPVVNPLEVRRVIDVGDVQRKIEYAVSRQPLAVEAQPERLQWLAV